MAENIKQFWKYRAGIFMGIFLFFCMQSVFATDGHLPSAFHTTVDRFQEIQTPIAGDDAIDMTQKLIRERIIPLAKFIFIGGGLVFLGMYAYQMTFGMGEESQLTDQRKNIMYAGMGFALITLADPMTKVLDPIGANDTTALLQDDALESVIMFVVSTLEVLLSTVLVVLIFYAGIRLVTADGDDETVSSAKNLLLNSVIGTVLIMLAKPLVTLVFYPRNGLDDVGNNQAEQLIQEGLGVFQYMLQFLGALVFVAFIYAGVQYILSGVDEDKKETAKRLLLWSIVGMVLIILSYSLVMIFIPSS